MGKWVATFGARQYHASSARSRRRSRVASPGPVFLQKPELAHYGGNCDAAATYVQTGVLSFDGNGNIAENIGTSFASPPVAALTANVEADLAQPPSRSLVMALVVHSAVLNSPGHQVARPQVPRLRGAARRGGRPDLHVVSSDADLRA